MRRARASCGAVVTAVKKASQSCQSASVGVGEMATEVTSRAAVSFSAEAEIRLERRLAMGAEKGFGGLMAVSSMEVIVGVGCSPG